MAANSSLVVSSLDFDTIRANLVTFLKSQDQFKDYDYTGSNLSVLLDLLSYNTYINNFYTNMAISEMFLDSAQIRDSIVSRAKELNYVPRSITSSKALVNITITPNDTPASIVIPKGTSFNSRVDDSVYTFTTNENIIVTRASNYTAANVALYEGVYVTETFVVNSSIENQRFIITNSECDISSLIVEVQESISDTTTTEYSLAQTLLGIQKDSTVYFVQPADKNRYEIVFGEGVVGKAPVNNNIIKVSYRISKGENSNGASSFIPTSTISGYATSRISVTTVSPAMNGSDRESIRSIKFNAPRHYQTQDRAVTNNDYKTILTLKYPNIRAINVYGGEDLTPPQYGKVFISVDFNTYDGIPQTLKDDITSYLKLKSPNTITPVVTDAEYTYIGIDCSVLYNINETTKTQGDIVNIIYNTIKDFNDAFLNEFKTTFRYSKLIAAIDESHPSILSTSLNTKLIKHITPAIGSVSAIIIDMQNAIAPSSVMSSNFTYSNVLCNIKDDGKGSILVVTSESGKEVSLIPNAGTVDYSTGKIYIKTPAIEDYTDYIKIFCTPQKLDNSVYGNVIVSIIDEDININASMVRE